MFIITLSSLLILVLIYYYYSVLAVLHEWNVQSYICDAATKIYKENKVRHDYYSDVELRN